MAKENKKATLSTEEQLDTALVPNWEQPYKVPANWCWTYIRAGFNVSSSKRVHKNDWRSDGVPFYRTRELVKLSERGFVDNELFITSELYEQFKKNYGVPSPGDLLISGVGTIGVPYVIDDERPFYFKDGNIIWFKNRGVFFPQYIYYLYKSTFMFNQLHAMSAGTTVDTYTIINAENTMLPLPPYAEQQRIVDRIESLFAKLDEAKEKAQEVVDGYDARRAAILHKAFTGELTAEWRKQKGIAYTAWKHVTVKDVCTDVKVGIVIKPSQYYTNKEYGTAAFRSANVREFHVDDFDWVYLNEIGIRTNQRSVVHTGDVLVVRSGNPGTACVVDERYDGYNAIDILIAVPNQTIITPDYLCAFTNSPIGRNLVAENKRGIALVHFNVSGYSNLKLPLPTIEEQEEITSSLFALLEKEQQAKETAEQAIARIGAMKKAILARAFRGELGTNDPADENAVKLLKEILNIEKTPTKRAKAITIPKELSANLRTELEKKIVKLFFQKDAQELPIKDIMTVSSKPFDVLDCLRGLERRRLIRKLENGNYRLMR